MDNPPVFEIELPSFQADVVERSRRMPVVVLFWTDQVAPAAETKSVLERLAGQYQGKFALALSDIAKDQTLAQQLRVQAIPSIRVVKDGQIVEQMEGPQGENALRQLIDGLTQSPSDQLKTQLAAYLQAEDFDGALAVLQQAVQAEPGNTAFKVEWADVMLIQGDIEGGPHRARRHPRRHGRPPTPPRALPCSRKPPTWAALLMRWRPLPATRPTWTPATVPHPADAGTPLYASLGAGDGHPATGSAVSRRTRAPHDGAHHVLAGEGLGCGQTVPTPNVQLLALTKDGIRK